MECVVSPSHRHSLTNAAHALSMSHCGYIMGTHSICLSHYTPSLPCPNQAPCLECIFLLSHNVLLDLDDKSFVLFATKRLSNDGQLSWTKQHLSFFLYSFCCKFCWTISVYYLLVPVQRIGSNSLRHHLLFFFYYCQNVSSITAIFPSWMLFGAISTQQYSHWKPFFAKQHEASAHAK